MDKKILIIAIIILLAIIIVFGIRFFTAEDSWICVDGQWVKHGNPSLPVPESGCGSNQLEQEIIIASPQQNQIINSPLKIEGKARGSWFFEAVFPIMLLDNNGKQIAFGQAQAINDWMTSDFVDFSAVLNFSPPATDSGVLLFQNDNPSGLPDNSKEFRLLIRFR